MFDLKMVGSNSVDTEMFSPIIDIPSRPRDYNPDHVDIDPDIWAEDPDGMPVARPWEWNTIKCGTKATRRTDVSKSWCFFLRHPEPGMKPLYDCCGVMTWVDICWYCKPIRKYLGLFLRRGIIGNVHRCFDEPNWRWALREAARGCDKHRFLIFLKRTEDDRQGHVEQNQLLDIF